MVSKQAFSSQKMVPATKQQAVYQYLKGRIMRVELPPGRRVRIEEVAREMGLSSIPVREALQFLQSEGLVQIRPHAGAVVSPIPARDVEETFVILEGVETMAVRRVCLYPLPGLPAALKVLLKRMDGAVKNVEVWSKFNMEFHLAIARATGMPRLLEITQRTMEDWDRIRRYFFSGGAPHRMDAAQREHHQLFRAIQKGDADVAEDLIRRHTRNAFAHYQKAIPTRKSETTED